MEKDYVEQLWKLSRKIYKKKYKLGEIKSKILEKEGTVPLLFNSLSGKVDAFESHSQRSAWVYKPFKDKFWYPGIEYKGVGLKGEKISALGKHAWGGVKKDWALAEHRFSKIAFEAGAFCQKPIMVYSVEKFNNMEMAVLVRTFVTPLRFSDLFIHKKVLNDYLDIRKQNLEEYTKDISRSLGQSVRLLFDKGLYHGSMEMNNITTEGELADFEPTYGGTWEGVMLNSEPKFQVLALTRLFGFSNTFFDQHKEAFIDGFSNAFFKKTVDVDYNSPAKYIIEKYIGRKLKTDERVSLPKIDKSKILNELKKINIKTDEQKIAMDLIKKRLS